MNAPGPGARELRELVRAYAASTDPAERASFDARLWQRFGTEGTVVITDLCRFSSTTRERGIGHFLAVIERAHCLVEASVQRGGGRLVKFEVDNGYALFETVDAAIGAMRELDIELRTLRTAGNNEIVLSIGIDHGPVLLVDDCDYFGDAVNTASKLSEDLAGAGEILVTNRALERLARADDMLLRPRLAKVSGIEIGHAQLEFLSQGTRR